VCFLSVRCEQQQRQRQLRTVVEDGTRYARECLLFCIFFSRSSLVSLLLKYHNKAPFYAGLSCLSLLHQTAQTNIKALRWDPIAIVCMNTGLRLPLCEDQIDSVADLLRDSSFRMRRPQITQYTRSKTLFL